MAIKLALDPYCQDCPHFEPKKHVLYGNNMAVETSVYCEYTQRCFHAAQWILKTNKKENNKE